MMPTRTLTSKQRELIPVAAITGAGSSRTESVHDRASTTSGPLSEPLGLYVHIPFCVRKCYYCDFASGPAPEAIREQYVDALVAEIRGTPWLGAAARTVFFGGGTPSELETPQLRRIVEALRESFQFRRGGFGNGSVSGQWAEDGLGKSSNSLTTNTNHCRSPELLNSEPSTPPVAPEWTIECNPGTVSAESLSAMVDMGFNRISLGVQSFHNHLLKAIGRIHNAREAAEAVFAARRAGFRRLNLDLIFCLPGQTLDEWKGDVERALDLEPDHLSLYNLTIEEKTEFGRRHRLGLMALPDEELSADMYEWVIDRMTTAGYVQYEVSNFALPGEECRHNQIYWRQEPFLGFGNSAASYIDGARWTNTASVSRYVATAGCADGPERSSEERLGPREAAGEAVMLGLRTGDGANLEAVGARHGVDPHRLWGVAIRQAVEDGLARLDGPILRLTRRGVMVANAVCAEFL